jgi:hypothetical protein
MADTKAATPTQTAWSEVLSSLENVKSKAREAIRLSAAEVAESKDIRPEKLALVSEAWAAIDSAVAACWKLGPHRGASLKTYQRDS